jgi:hypothetical protein
MEQLTNITERARSAPLNAAPPIPPKPLRAPLYASPWMALFILLRREFRQPRTLES